MPTEAQIKLAVTQWFHSGINQVAQRVKNVSAEEHTTVAQKLPFFLGSKVKAMCMGGVRGLPLLTGVRRSGTVAHHGASRPIRAVELQGPDLLEKLCPSLRFVFITLSSLP